MEPPEYIRVERTGPSIREALREAAPDELPEFEAEFRIALAEADDDFDLAHVDAVLNPPTPEELDVIERVRRGDFRGMSTRVGGEWVPLDDDDATQAAYDRSPTVREIVERGLAAPPEDMHPRPPRRSRSEAREQKGAMIDGIAGLSGLSDGLDAPVKPPSDDA